jgi:opacity protein-like surface antigen
MRSICAILIIIFTLLPSSPGRADKGEWQMAVGLGTHTLVTSTGNNATTQLAPTIQLGVAYALTDYWQLAIELFGGAEVLLKDGPGGFAQALIEARFVFDALTWVPYVGLGFGTTVRDAPSSDIIATDATAHVGIGVDYRPSRRWSIGLSARYNFLLTDFDGSTGPIQTTITFKLYMD